MSEQFNPRDILLTDDEMSIPLGTRPLGTLNHGQIIAILRSIADAQLLKAADWVEDLHLDNDTCPYQIIDALRKAAAVEEI